MRSFPHLIAAAVSSLLLRGCHAEEGGGILRHHHLRHRPGSHHSRHPHRPVEERRDGMEMRAQQRHAQRQRAHRGSRALPKRKQNDQEGEDGKPSRTEEGRRSNDNKNRDEDAEKSKKRKKKKRKGTVINEGPSDSDPQVVVVVVVDDDAGNNNNNIFVDDSSHLSPPPPSPSSSSPSPTVAPEPLCRSIIAVGSSRLFPDDPHLLSLSPESRMLYEDSDFDEEFVCELQATGETVPLLSSSRQLMALREALQEGTLVSGVSTIEFVVPEVIEVIEVAPSPSPSSPPPSRADGGGGGGGGGAIVGAASSALPTSTPSRASTTTATTTTTTATTAAATTTTVVVESVALPPGDVYIRTDPGDVLGGGGRSLLRYSGTKTVLVVRVTAPGEGGSVASDAATVSNKFFGTSGDQETMMSQFASCSYGAFDVAYDQSYGGVLSAPGVLDVGIPISLDNPRTVIRQAMQRAAEDKLGIKLPGPFGHVLFVQGRCRQDCGWAAYAYVNSWLSVYQGDYFMYPAVSMHELGHNLNFGHSGGLDLKTYSDHTCLMGNPLYKDDVADMCFNPAKNYQITANGGGWYDPGRVETFDTANSAIWGGKLVGIAEYGNLDGNAEHDRSRVVLKVETGTLIDLYMGFNRATGINEDNKQASNMVTIVEANGDGRSYSTSALKATLVQGQSYAVANWRGTGVTLTVYVDEIRHDVVPGYAAVRIVLDGNRAGGVTTFSPTARPSRMPTTSRPTRPPVPKPTRPPTSPPTTPPTPPPTPVPTPPVSFVDVIHILFRFADEPSLTRSIPAALSFFIVLYIAPRSSLRYPLRIPPLNLHCLLPPLNLHCLLPPLNLHSLPPLNLHSIPPNLPPYLP